MGYQDAMNALNLQMPRRIPRTEYSAGSHWALISKVTGIPVNENSPDDQKHRARKAFEKAWNYGLSWSIKTNTEALTGPRTSMGHAVYQSDGSDYRNDVYCPFKTVEEVLRFDPYAAYGSRDREKLIAEFNGHYDWNCKAHPDQVNMTGIYITMVSGLLEIFGWEMLLEGLAEDSDEFGAVANRYADWILQYFEALACCKSPVVMVHDDICWTSGPFVQPAWYRKYVFPNYEKLLDPLKKAGKKILYTSDGTIDRLLDDVVATGVNALVIEPTTDMETIAKKYGKTHAFVGNADCRVLTFGDKPAIRAEVERCMKIGRDCPGFILAVGNHIPANVPVENALYYNECYMEMVDRW